MKKLMIGIVLLLSNMAFADDKITIEAGSSARIDANVPTMVSCSMPKPECKIERTYRSDERYYHVEINQVVRSAREISGEEAAKVASKLRAIGECK